MLEVGISDPDQEKVGDSESFDRVGAFQRGCDVEGRSVAEKFRIPTRKGSGILKSKWCIWTRKSRIIEDWMQEVEISDPDQEKVGDPEIFNKLSFARLRRSR
jgi:hypothetical protein